MQFTAIYKKFPEGYAAFVEELPGATRGWTKPAADELYNLGYVHDLGYSVDCVLNDEPPKFGVDDATGAMREEVVRAHPTN